MDRPSRNHPATAASFASTNLVCGACRGRNADTTFVVNDKRGLAALCVLACGRLLANDDAAMEAADEEVDSGSACHALQLVSSRPNQA